MLFFAFLLALDVRFTTPYAVATDGRTDIYYEIHLTNFTAAPLGIHEVRIVDADRGTLLATLGDLPTVPPDGHAVVFVAIPGPARRLRHEFDGVPTAPIEVSALAPVVLDPPLRTGAWVAVHDPSWPRGHRRVIYTVGGTARIPGRFAVDWVGVDAEGHTGNGDQPADAVGYGAPVLAGADARVAGVRDDMVESPSIRGNPKHGLGNEAGNYVALELGRGRFAFYEHLRPGSVRVKPGQRVHRGQIIGELGMSGDSTGPHLHLHVADSDKPLEGEGLPFVLRGMVEIGRYRNLGELSKTVWTSEAPRPVVEWPAGGAVIRFEKR